MSNYKVGDVAALFSKPKEPTTESGKKLQSLFKEFHNKNRSPFKSEEANCHWTNKSKAKNEEGGDQRAIKKNKRKFSSLDTESQSNEPNLKRFKEIDTLQGNKKKVKNSNFVRERDFSQKKGVSKSKTNDSYGSDSKSTIVSELSNNPKAAMVKSSFIKKSKRKTYDNIDSSEKSHIENSQMEQLENSGLISLKDEIKEFLQKNSKTLKKGRDDNANSEEEPQEISGDSFNFKNRSKFCKTNSKKSKKIIDDNKSEEDTPKTVEASVNNNRSKFIKSKKSKKGSDNTVNPEEDSQKKLEASFNFMNRPKAINEVTDFIRKPKKKNKETINDSFGSDDGKKCKMSNKKTFANNNDTLFQSEDENYVKNKKFKKEFHSTNNTGKKTFAKRKPDFVKLLEQKEDHDEHEQLSRTLFVGNLPIDTRSKDLEKLFSPFGEIQFIRFKGIETDKAKIFAKNAPKSLHRNYAAESAPGFIVFKERESAVKALTLCGTVFKDRHITVDFAMPAGSRKLYDNKRSVFIGNLPFDVTDENIWNAFSDCGKIEGVRVVRDKETGIGKGFGYVLFSTIESKENALSLDVNIEGRLIRIKAVDSNQGTQKKSNTANVLKTDTFKSRAIKFKQKNKNPNSRKSITKLVKKEKTKHKKKKIASLLQKSMK